MSQEELKKIAAEYELYNLQLKALSDRLELVQNTLAEIELTKKTIEEIKSRDDKTEFLAPIGSNSFVKAELKDTERVLIGLGANIVAEVNVDKALEELSKRKTDFQKLLLSLRGQIQQVQVKVNEIKNKLQEEYRKTQG
ncbi:MAG: prefoldin subunit alpha [Candidatus Odinarchaeia archaeon]